MSHFEGAEHFHARHVQLLPLRFERMPSGQYLVSNIVGEFVRLSRGAFDETVSGILKLKDRQQRVKPAPPPSLTPAKELTHG